MVIFNDLFLYILEEIQEKEKTKQKAKFLKMSKPVS